MNPPLSRRSFIKLELAALAGLAFRPYFNVGENLDYTDMVRVASKQISVYSKPSDKSEIRFQHYRDELVHLYYEVISKDGPDYNPLWYRVWGGYMHSAHLERVKMQLNMVLTTIPEKGQLVEITVPYTQSMVYNKQTKIWEPGYRLYYGSNHWVVGIDAGPDGEPWYRIQDDLTRIEYHAQATHLRPILPDELKPISPDIPPEKKRIEVSLQKQVLTAFEYEKVVLETKISSGMRSLPGSSKTPTETPTGTFYMTSKMPSKHMGDGDLTTDPEAYVFPGVPWVSFFETVTGVACHGTYWHTNFGAQMSHGCINMRNEDAKFIYLWTTPAVDTSDWQHKGFGTKVVVY